MNDIQTRIGLFAGKIAQLAAESGLTWDEAVASFGLATKALAVAAHDNGDGTKESCVQNAHKRFEEAMSQDVRVFIAGANLTQLRDHYSEVDAESLLANSNIKVHRPH